MTNPRITACKILTRVLTQYDSLNDAFHELKPNDVDNSLIKEICFGVCRWYPRLEKLSELFLKNPLKEKDFDVQLLLFIGFYQIIYLRIPDHAVVHETVEAVKKLKKNWAAGLVNGVLREFLRRKEVALAKIDNTLEGRYAHPKWLIEQLKKDWPNQWPAICDANNQRPPLTLRINLAKISREDYLAQLQENNIAAMAHEIVASAINLEKAVNVRELPGFMDGIVSVQDASAQLAAQFLDLAPKQKVLDACAAPGGKTCHLLEKQPDIELIAVDIDADRAKLIQENLTREQLTAKIIVADVEQTKTWWDGKLFDRILLDAPCSATGVIRRHPDIKLLRESSDITNTAEKQMDLLTQLWPLLKPNGILLYATCSILKKENSDLIAKFLSANPDAELESLDIDIAKNGKIGLQILPGEQNLDGFFYARLRKKC